MRLTMAKQTIIEIIISAGKTGKYPRVSKRQLIEQMIEFYKLRDADKMKQMFEAYKNWEIRCRDRSRTIEETIQLSKENLDFIARIADNYLDSGDIEVGVYRALQLSKRTSGPISQFYRKTIDYQPFDPAIN